MVKLTRPRPAAPPPPPGHTRPSVATTQEKERQRTRICVKNLPPRNFDAHQLRAWLLQQWADDKTSSNGDVALHITDVKVLWSKDGTSRRVGFVGLASSEQAAWCVRYLHRAYCHSCKLVVEFAQSWKEATSERKMEPSEMETKALGKRSKMGITSNTNQKCWANDDMVLPEPHQMHPKGDGNTDDDESSSTSDSSSANSPDDVPDKGIATEMQKSVTISHSIDAFLQAKRREVDDLGGDDVAPTHRPGVSIQNGANDDSSTTSTSSGSVSSERANDNRNSNGESALRLDGSTVTTSLHEQHSGSGDNALNAPGSIFMAEHTNGESDALGQLNQVLSQEQSPLLSTKRLFLRNLPFTATTDNVRTHFAPFGSLTECYLPTDDVTEHGKGFGFVTYATSEQAAAALTAVDGTDFQGRLLHVMYACRPKVQPHHESTGGGRSYKEQQERLKQQQAVRTTTGQFTAYVRSDAVVDTLAHRLGLRQGDILNVDQLSSGDAAVRLALGETAVIEENRRYFAQHGIDMETLVLVPRDDGVESADETKVQRSKTSILVKNLPFDTTQEDLLKTIVKCGSPEPEQILLPPSRTIAVLNYQLPHQAKQAFKQLAYRRFKSVPLFLEWAPVAAKIGGDGQDEPVQVSSMAPPGTGGADDEDATAVAGPVPTLYVKNLNFATTEEQLFDFITKHSGGVRAVRIPQKVAAIKRKAGTTRHEELRSMSMGFGFIEFHNMNGLQHALKMAQGKILDGFQVELAPSGRQADEHRGQRAPPEASSNETKVLVKNVPFQATRKELLKLFGSFGQLKKVRLPKKLDGSHRGFAFVEFLSHKEAVAAMQALASTHLYGRHLVLEWASSADSMQALRTKVQRDMGTASAKKLPNKKVKIF